MYIFLKNEHIIKISMHFELSHKTLFVCIMGAKSRIFESPSYWSKISKKVSLKEVVFCDCLKGENQRFLAFSWKSLWCISKFWDTADYYSTAYAFQLRTSPEKFSSSQICGAFLAYSPTVTPWLQVSQSFGRVQRF